MAQRHIQEDRLHTLQPSLDQSCHDGSNSMLNVILYQHRLCQIREQVLHNL